MNIIVHGATGRMGRVLCRLILDGHSDAALAAQVSPDCPQGGAGDCYCSLEDYTGPADCVVDFSHHSAVQPLLDYCLARRLPVVIATTGHTEEERNLIARAAQQIPVFFSANMSLGAAALADLAKRAAALFPGADIEIIEAHHNQKVDVPSGTALMLANSIRQARPNASFLVGRHQNGKRTQNEIGIHSLRYGNEVGTHEILISTGSETITLKHQAHSRDLFAEGALTAAAFLQDKEPGLYQMNHIVNQE